MPSDETRRALRMLGVAVTEYEDAVRNGAPAAEIREAESVARTRLQEVTALVERLSAEVSGLRAPR